MGLSAQDFLKTLEALGASLPGGDVAAAVSGGPDSMALLFLLSGWAKEKPVRVYAYTVDHGLRVEAAEEARLVARYCDTLPGVTHRTLCWSEEKPQSRILEEARQARYDLIAGAMEEDGVRGLFVAHHRDDQAETFLIRLAKGSGLDGLCAMQAVQARGGILLLRPFLDVPKEDLVSTCDDNAVPYVNDPTNENKKYLRPRLRAAQVALEEEGLSAKRLAVTARRLARARNALEAMADTLFESVLIERRAEGFLFDAKALADAPEELVLRVLLLAMEQVSPSRAYGPRMEKAEQLAARIGRKDFRGATLGGCVFKVNDQDGTLWVGKE